MQTDDALTVIEANIDWLTVTAKRGPAADSLNARAHELLHQSMSAGNYLQTFRSHGYRGEKAGKVSHGRRHDGSILTLTSREAARNAIPLLGGDNHVTRLDLQITAADDSAYIARAQDTYDALQRGVKKEGRPISSELRRNSGGGNTLYLGSRQSDVFARLYDKGVEAKVAKPGECWRYEVQYRRKPAQFVAGEISKSKAAHDSIAALVTDYFSNHGLLVPQTERDWASLELQLKDDLSKREPSDQDRKLRWLSANVARTVERLIKSGRRDDVLRALGLKDDE